MTGAQIVIGLRTGAPRPMHAELEGYAWLPRMLDKARASASGTVGDYEFGCPIDRRCMARLRVTRELVLELVDRHGDDHAVLAALRAYGIPTAQDAWFDAPAFERELEGGD